MSLAGDARAGLARAVGAHKAAGNARHGAVGTAHATAVPAALLAREHPLDARQLGQHAAAAAQQAEAAAAAQLINTVAKNLDVRREARDRLRRRAVLCQHHDVSFRWRLGVLLDRGCDGNNLTSARAVHVCALHAQRRHAGGCRLCRRASGQEDHAVANLHLALQDAPACHIPDAWHQRRGRDGHNERAISAWCRRRCRGAIQHVHQCHSAVATAADDAAGTALAPERMARVERRRRTCLAGRRRRRRHSSRMPRRRVGRPADVAGHAITRVSKARQRQHRHPRAERVLPSSTPPCSVDAAAAAAVATPADFGKHCDCCVGG
mmetsp:Transcript_25811/g.76436  ORF Transcript_25811/g.76436 Transcript_25811/m.76436 type:complete len:322 (+) Transcript_25811:909-1874(+)